jgi:hypothetical protein
MANDCDNESIIIEETTRQEFFNYLDKSARVLVFKNILDTWAAKLPEMKNQISPVKLEKVKEKILQTFRAWIKLSLPTEVFENLVEDNPNLLAFVF